MHGEAYTVLLITKEAMKVASC